MRFWPSQCTTPTQLSRHLRTGVKCRHQAAELAAHRFWLTEVGMSRSTIMLKFCPFQDSNDSLSFQHKLRCQTWYMYGILVYGRSSKDNEYINPYCPMKMDWRPSLKDWVNNGHDPLPCPRAKHIGSPRPGKEQNDFFHKWVCLKNWGKPQRILWFILNLPVKMIMFGVCQIFLDTDLHLHCFWSAGPNASVSLVSLNLVHIRCSKSRTSWIVHNGFIFKAADIM